MKRTRKEINAAQSLKRTKLAIEKHYDKGETPQDSKQLAALMDRIYNTNYIERYHS